jgi:rare lipoprotein A
VSPLWWLLVLAGMAPLAAWGATPARDDAGGSAAAASRTIEEGEASWYGPRHAGLRTSSGERFNPHAMTAAHPTLPLGSVIRVTVEDTGRSVIVRVNDREPPHGVRVIDLSQGAAARLGITRRGTAMVSIEPAGPGEMPEEVAEAPVPKSHAQADRTAHYRPSMRGARHARLHRR